ncbi:hypothetical protein [Streptomyces halstedii]
MTDFDPTDPWGSRSPWDVAQPDTNPTAQEAPVTNQTSPVAPNPFKIGFTLKAAAGYEAEWLTPTVYGGSAEETAQRGKDLLLAMRSVGLIELTSQAAEYTRGQYQGAGKRSAAAAPTAQPTFQNGQVQYQQAPQPPFGGGGGGDSRGVTSCVHGQRTHRTGGSWEAMFCPAREKSEQCEPAWLNKKSGKFEVKG